jgi:16S rRNA (cytosine967-C5)-methyltransferase
VSSSAAVRARAAQIVAQVATHGHSLDALLAKETRGTSQERGLLRALCYDSVRWYLRLDALLGQLLNRPKQPLTPELHALAIVGLCQLLYMSVPAHAAVDETVNAARVLKQPRAASLLNAVLRRSQREGERMLAALDRDIAVRSAHPPWLVRMLAEDWPGTFETILSANNQHPPFWLRVNRLRCSGVEYRRKLAAEGHQVTRALFDDCALLLDRAVDVEELPGFEDGMISVQDAAAQLAAHVLAPRAGDRVLDACAAPGGKTCHLLELQPQLKELVAVDVSKERLERVQENLRRLALRAKVVTGDAADPETWWDGEPFERILLDVPCSATGVIRRHPDIKLLRRPHDIPALTARQLRILERAWTLLAPGGRLLYASCSALQAENSAIVTTFLRANAQARADARDVTQTALVDAGIPVTGTGTHMIARSPGYAIAAGAGGMDGFYYACLEKVKG